MALPVSSSCVPRGGTVPLRMDLRFSSGRAAAPVLLCVQENPLAGVDALPLRWAFRTQYVCAGSLGFLRRYRPEAVAWCEGSPARGGSDRQCKPTFWRIPLRTAEVGDGERFSLPE